MRPEMASSLFFWRNMNKERYSDPTAEKAIAHVMAEERHKRTGGRSTTKINFFYQSTAWHDTRKAYLKSVGGLCEECLAEGRLTPAKFVHHKIWLTPDNVSNTDISLSFDNLEALCADHHNEIHKRHAKRYSILPDGSVVAPLKKSSGAPRP